MNAILDEHPTQLEVHGPELLTLVDQLKARNVVILGMAVTCVSSYRLTLAWPRPQQQSLVEKNPPSLPEMAKTAV